MITPKDKQFLLKLKEDGKTPEQAVQILKDVKAASAPMPSAPTGGMVGKLTGMAEKAVESGVEVTPEMKERIAPITQQVKLEQQSPTVGAMTGMIKGAQEADIEQDKYTRPGEVVGEFLEETVGQVPYVGPTLAGGLEMAAKPITKPLDIGVATYEAGEQAFETVGEAGDQIGEALFGVDIETGEDLTPSERIIKGGGGLADLFGGGLGIAFAPVTGVIDELPGDLEKGVEIPFEKLNDASMAVSKNFQESLGIPEGSEQGQVLDKLFGVLGQTLMLKAAKDVSKSELPGKAKQKVGEVAGKTKQQLIKTKEALVPKVAETAVKAKEGVGVLATKVGEKATAVKQKFSQKGKQKQLAPIQEKIAPKLTVKEKQLAISEGRVIEGKTTKLGGKKADTILPSEALIKQSQTIQKNIPNAKKMSEFELANKLKETTTKKATELKPQMEATKVEPVRIKQAQTEWTQLKEMQANTPEFANFPGSKRVQKQFENFLKEAEGAKSLDGVWNTRAKYDATISKAVKEATPQSPPFTQLQHEMWLQNRQILNDIIHDSSTGLGGVSKNAFSEMSDLYSARQNIVSKGAIDIKGEPGVVGKTLSMKNIIKIGGTAIIGEKVAKAIF
jgi:hypothetical protein